MRALVLSVASLFTLACTPPAIPPACDDLAKNGDETDVDCGGTCNPCATGKSCESDADCVTATCLDTTCRAPTCSDGRKNSTETDLDCGGPCDGCATGATCGNGDDCASGVCEATKCLAPSCDDGVKNGTEGDRDCGGSCDPCDPGEGCHVAEDCTSAVCHEDVCATPSCSDGRPNGDEADEDCGGSCEPCGPGRLCREHADCSEGSCTEGVCDDATCVDERQNGNETDQDCGGNDCGPCADGLHCTADVHCLSRLCLDGTCAVPTCNDERFNGHESDVDCGGPCDGCEAHQHCERAADCRERVCLSATQTCAVPTCDDDTKNADETDVDCGGACEGCRIDKRCLVDDDCDSGRCAFQSCAPARFPNGDFELDEPDTAGDALTGWRVETWNETNVRGTNPTVQATATIVQGERFRLNRALRSTVRNFAGNGNGDPNGRYGTQWIQLESPYPLRNDTLWLRRTEVSYETPSRYSWGLEVTFEAAGQVESVLLACRSWGNGEGCAGTSFDSSIGRLPGADGQSWFVHAVTVPASMRGRPVTVGLRHWQDSWDGNTASSSVLFDFVDDGPWCSAEESCGGSCAACSAGQRCFGDADCGTSGLCLYDRCTAIESQLPNGGFELDGTDPSELAAGWRVRFQTSNDSGVSGTGPNVFREIGLSVTLSMDGQRSMRSLLRNVNGGGGGDTQGRHALHRLDAAAPVNVGARSLVIHRRPVTYSTSSRWAWSIGVEFDDGTVGASVLLACRCWGANEGCSGNSFDSATETVSGVSGDWSRHVVPLPANLDASRVRVTLWHHQDSWDGTTAESQVHFDAVRFE